MDPKLYLYNLTLQRSTSISIAISGHFSGGKVQEIALAKGHILELVRPDPLTGKVQSLLSVDVFGIIRSMIAFRLTGGLKDYIIIGSDSGRIVILEYNDAKNCFDKVCHQSFVVYFLFLLIFFFVGSSRNIRQKWLSKNCSRTISCYGSKRSCSYDIGD